MSNKKRSIIILTTVILVILLLVLLLFMINKNNTKLKNDNQGITTTTNNQTNNTLENEEKSENTTEKTIITTITNNNSNKITSTNKISSTKTTSKSSKTTKIDNNEEVVLKKLSATAKGTSTDYNIVKAELSISNAHTPFSLEDYNGELMYRFTKIVELDVYSESAAFNFTSKTNLLSRMQEQAINKAKELYGDTGCVIGVEKGYAMNKSGGYVGIIGKMIIGQLNEYNWCENNIKSIYLNNRTPLTQNDDKYIFE